jgi:hypothetical protein
MLLRLGVQLETAGDFANFDAVIFAGVAGDKFIQRGLYGQLFVTECGGKLVEGSRLVGSVDDSFQSGFSFFIGDLIFSTR